MAMTSLANASFSSSRSSSGEWQVEIEVCQFNVKVVKGNVDVKHLLKCPAAQPQSHRGVPRNKGSKVGKGWTLTFDISLSLIWAIILYLNLGLLSLRIRLLCTTIPESVKGNGQMLTSKLLLTFVMRIMRPALCGCGVFQLLHACGI